jgi:hypothetical protein
MHDETMHINNKTRFLEKEDKDIILLNIFMYNNLYKNIKIMVKYEPLG